MFSHWFANVRLPQNAKTLCSRYITRALPIITKRKKKVEGQKVCFLCIFIRENLSSGIKNVSLEEVRFRLFFSETYFELQ
jgi:hypothetical protein